MSNKIIPDKEVLISISGTHAMYGEEPENVELKTAGTLKTTGSGFDICYEESELTGMDGTLTTFRIKDGQMSLIRTGAITMDLAFEEGTRHDSLYDIGEGALLVQVVAQTVRVAMTPEGGSFDLAYSIDVENAPLGIISYHVVVKPI